MRGQRFFMVDQTGGRTFAVVVHGRVLMAAPASNRDGQGINRLWPVLTLFGGYSWLPESSPSERDVANAPEWLLEPLVHQPPTTAEVVAPTAVDAKRVPAMLACIDPLKNTSYDEWLQVGMAMHNTDPGLLKDWVEWSRAMPNFDEDECLGKWESFAKSTRGSRLTIASLHHWAKAGGYKEPKRQTAVEPQGETEGETLSPIDEWDALLKGLVDPNHPCFERNSVRRQIRAATAARPRRLSKLAERPRQFPQHQRNLIVGTGRRALRAAKARLPKEYLIKDLITMRCLTGIAAFNKVGKTKLATELVASLIFQQPFMGNRTGNQLHHLRRPQIHSLVGRLRR